MSACVLSHVWLFAALLTVAYQAPLSMEFSWQECWSGLGIFLTQELNSCLLCLLHWQVDSLPVVLLAGNARDVCSIPGSGRSPGVGSGNPLQYYFLENSMDRRAWRATVHGVAKSRTWLSIHSPAILFIISATAKWLQSCPTLCDPIDGSPPGSAVPGILQARTLEWVAISSLIQCKCYGNSCQCITFAFSFLELFGIFFFILNIFTLRLVESMDVEPTNSEGWVYYFYPSYLIWLHFDNVWWITYLWGFWLWK